MDYPDVPSPMSLSPQCDCAVAELDCVLFDGPVKTGKTQRALQYAYERGAALFRVRAVPLKVQQEHVFVRLDNGVELSLVLVATGSEIIHHPTTRQCNTVFIDEAHFCRDLVNVLGVLREQRKNVVLAALSSTADMQPWPAVTAALPFFTEMHRLSAKCYICGAQGHASGSVQTGEYVPMCFSCHALRRRRSNSGGGGDGTGLSGSPPGLGTHVVHSTH
jgi:thymidine kinase